MQHLVAELALDGAGLAVGLGDRLLHVSVHGDFAADRALPIGSASTWFAVATILALVDAGTLDLDATVSRYLQEFDRPDKRSITLRQCLSCTAGFHAEVPAARDRRLDLDGMAKALADQPLANGPGLEFLCGGVTFEVAACAAVRARGLDWHALFRARIGAPLGLRDTAFGRLAPPGTEAGTANAPWVAGGAVSSLRDCERLLRMLALGGEIDGVRVLSKRSVDAMFTAHTAGRTVRFPGLADGVLAYGFGTWLQELPGGGVRGSDLGASGLLPWVDRDLGLYGVLAVDDGQGRLLPRLRTLQAAARELAVSPAVAGRDETVALEHGGRSRRYLLHVPPGAEQKAKLPLLVVLHGGGGNGAQIAAATGFSPLADRMGFSVVYPDGTGPLRGRLLTWNSGGIPVYAAEQKVDDVGFLRAVVTDCKRRVAVDPERVYATGISNGAMMCHRLAREAADVFAAVAPVAGAMDFTAADDPTPIAVMIVHGTADEHVRYDGGRPERGVGRAGDRVDKSVADAVGYYRARNGLAEAPRVEVDGDVRIEAWDRSVDGITAPAPVRVVTLTGGGHAWPGGVRGAYPGADAPFPWDATGSIWAFFAEVRRQTHR